MKDRIKLIQSATKMSQQDFAKAIGVAPGSLSSIYSGRTQPTNNYVNGIHQAFPDININWLMFGEGDMYVEGKEDVDHSPAPTDSEYGDDSNTLFDQPDSPIGDVLPFATPRVTPPSSRLPQVNMNEKEFTPQSPETTYNTLPKNIDIKMREVKEIRVFFSDGTYESFVPAKS